MSAGKDDGLAAPAVLRGVGQIPEAAARGVSAQIHYFRYNTPQMFQAYLNSQKLDHNLHLDGAQLDILLTNPMFKEYNFRDIIFPQVKYLNIQGSKRLTTLQYFNFPDSLTELVVRSTGIKSLLGVKFPLNYPNPTGNAVIDLV
jgi:hypothetical protein